MNASQMSNPTTPAAGAPGSPTHGPMFVSIPQDKMPVKVMIKHGHFQLPMYDEKGVLLNPEIFAMKPCWKGMYFKKVLNVCEDTNYEAI